MQLSPRTPHVRIEGPKHSPGYAVSVLAMLPAGVRMLQLNACCTDLLLPFLRRFRQLEELRIPGNAADIPWDVQPVLQQALQALRSVRLSFARLTITYDGDKKYSCSCLPNSTAGALAAATGLARLALVSQWSEAGPALCTRLPALRDLGLDLRYLVRAELIAALGMLCQLSQLVSLALGLSTNAVGDEGMFDSEQENDDSNEMESGLLAGLARQLTELRLTAGMLLPRDLRSLSSLRALRLDTSWGAPSILGNEPLTWLAALTRLELDDFCELPDPRLVATLPSLATLHISRAHDFVAALSQLRPYVAVDPF